MKTASFYRLAQTVARNARGYASKRACELALARVKRAWEKDGAYGARAGYKDEAVAACQDRWVELDGVERDARTAAILAE